MSSPSKIGRLPRPLLNELNRRLQRNESSTPILAWLNALPEVQALLEAEFAGASITKQNLSEWRTAGLARWETRQDALADILTFEGDAGELDTATRGRLAERLATDLAGRYARLLHHWNGEVTGDISKKLRALRTLGQDIAHLRRCDHSAARVKLEQVRVETAREPDNEALFMKFEEWALNLGVQEFLTASYETPRDRENARRKLLDLPPLPATDDPESAPGARLSPPPHPAPPTEPDHQPSPDRQSDPAAPNIEACPVESQPPAAPSPSSHVQPCQPPSPGDAPAASSSPAPHAPDLASPHPPACPDQCEPSGHNFCRKCGLSPADIHNWPLRSEEMRREILFRVRERLRGRLC